MHLHSSRQSGQRSAGMSSLIIAIDICNMCVHQSIRNHLPHHPHRNRLHSHHFLWKSTRTRRKGSLCAAKCHVMPCPRHFALLCYIRHAMRCHAMRHHAMSSHVMLWTGERTTRGRILISGYKRRTCKMKRQLCACLRACVVLAHSSTTKRLSDISTQSLVRPLDELACMVSS